MKIVGVMGPGDKQASKSNLDCAYQVGKMVANTGAALLCGGMSGTMEASAQGAQESGGLTVGICPTNDRNDLNPYIDIGLATGMHAGRNYMNVISCDVLVFVSVSSPGTLSELAHAIQMEKPSIVVGGSEALKEFVYEMDTSVVTFVETLNELKETLDRVLG